MTITAILLILLNTILVKNVIFMQFLGTCPYLGVSKKIDTAMGMGLAVIFVMTLATAVTWPLYYFVLTPLNLQYLDTLSFILVIAALVQLVEIVLRKTAKALFDALGIYLPLITTNCAILGIALLAIKKEFHFLEAMIYTVGTAVGFLVAILVFAGIRERVEIMEVPKPLIGVPISLVIAGILAMAFMGFTGLGS